MIRHVTRLGRRLPPPVRRPLVRAVSRARSEVRRRRRARWGNLRRREPFSAYFGYDRGTPIDRYYLHRFFAEHGAGVTGRVLEVKDPAFADRYGDGVTHVDLVDIDPTNGRATVLADLAEPGSLPEGAWDCVIVPQTLNLVDDPGAAVANLWRSVRPGGVLLVTAPSVARQEPVLRAIDRWRFLPLGLEFLLREGCPGGVVTVSAYGSLVTSVAFLQGLAAEELRTEELLLHDPAHPVLACGRVDRPRSS